MSEGSAERPHRTGLFWLDFIVAVSAIAISVISLFVALRSDRTQEQLLAASTWPSLQFQGGNFENNVRHITLRLRNAGVGPARIRWMTIDYNGRRFTSSQALLSACCGGYKALGTVVTDYVSRTVLIPHETAYFITVNPTRTNEAAFERFDRERHQMHIRACYCSVLNDCWLLDNKSMHDPAPVKSCEPEPAQAYLE